MLVGLMLVSLNQHVKRSAQKTTIVDSSSHPHFLRTAWTHWTIALSSAWHLRLCCTQVHPWSHGMEVKWQTQTQDLPGDPQIWSYSPSFFTKWYDATNWKFPPGVQYIKQPIQKLQKSEFRPSLSGELLGPQLTDFNPRRSHICEEIEVLDPEMWDFSPNSLLLGFSMLS